MVQPQYSPQEALERIKLMMEYDSSKTLTENEKIISEQYVAPTVAAGATGAALGAGAVAASTTTAGASVIVPVMSALGVGATAAGAIVGGAAALAVLPLVYWLVTKDTGANKVKKMFEMCSSESAKIAKLERKMQDAELRSISDDIEDAIINDSFGFQGGTDEEKLFGAFKKLESGTASDFCALVAMYNKNSDSGDLFDDLDSDIDAESEWKQIFRPIRNCVEDSLLTIKDEEPKKTGGGGGGSKVSDYKSCPETLPIAKFCKNETIRKVQGCLGITADGYFGPKTQTALEAKGVDGTSITQQTVDKVCNQQDVVSGEEPEVSGEDVTINSNDANF
jgi:hypothetical protein